MVLLLELAFIRQVPAEVRAISYFTNLMFTAGFSGLGLGCMLARQRSLAPALPVGLLLVFGFVVLARGVVIQPDATAVHYFLQYPDLAKSAPELPLFPAAAASFLFAAVPFVALGQALARAMDAHPRLLAYGWDIAGSLAGTITFSLCAAAGLPPWIWPVGIAAAWAGAFERTPLRRALFALAGVPFIAFAWSSRESAWSPYYLVQTESAAEGMRVFVNSSFHQLALDFRAESLEGRKLSEAMLERFGIPYKLYRDMHAGANPRRVLILGAGTGNDVWVARANHASEIVAVEIDPVILSLGRERNTVRPYDDASVRAVVDDARHFLRTTQERFDLIVFGTLDSQALLSGSANLRLENYVYTRESLLDARRVLEDRGVVVLYYSIFQPWLYERIFSTVREAFGDQAMILFDRDVFLFNTLIVATKGERTFTGSPDVIAKYGHGVPSSDDWPFIYLQRPTIAPVYLELCALVALVMLGAFVLLRRLSPVRGLYANFGFLGLGFTLMEASAIVRLALLFGSTWWVNALVFASCLLTVFAANYTVLRRIAPPLGWAWIGLFASIAANYAFPLPLLFELATPLRALVCAVGVGLPVYCASVCFSRLFAAEPTTGYPLGVNLIGAMAGGLVEYSSMALGMRAVWGVAFCVYALAFAATRWLAPRAAAAR
jgi:spermidine synthase